MPRLILWDIDRTLIFAGGVDKAVWSEVCSELAGHPVALFVGTSGRTDPQILLDAFLAAGLDEAHAHKLLPEALELEAERLSAKQQELRANGHEMPGARDILAALSQTEGIVQTVLTGNIKPNAALKLHTFGLAHYLDLDIGAYGSDDSHRPNLVRLARQRATAARGADFPPEQTVLIGDSLRDVEAGRLGGGRVIAVATGRTSTDALRDAGADVVLEDLRSTEAVLRAVLKD